MQISTLLENFEIKELQQKFYAYFENGYVFEEFLKEYLIKIGLDEVEITQKTRDGGIDIKAIRKGIGDFSETDKTYYYIQAKRYDLKNKIGVRTIRELKGTIPFGYKGMLITTSDFTSDVLNEAKNDQSKPVVLVNGESLVTSCIDNGIGFVFKPIFSKKQMDIFLRKEMKNFSKIENTYIVENQDKYIEKNITSNDIRARIISVPSSIMALLEGEKSEILVNDEKKYIFSINKRRNYFARVTEFLREYKLLTNDGVIVPKKAKWFFDKKKGTIKIYIEE